ncbi:MAG: hypothetical protein M1833_000347 [Piccolia ochrophora]|nr:MAG: hypothetical protein M1833_000347 [Piccolia ochrophora]
MLRSKHSMDMLKRSARSRDKHRRRAKSEEPHDKQGKPDEENVPPERSLPTPESEGSGDKMQPSQKNSNQADQRPAQADPACQPISEANLNKARKRPSDDEINRVQPRSDHVSQPMKIEVSTSPPKKRCSGSGVSGGSVHLPSHFRAQADVDGRENSQPPTPTPASSKYGLFPKPPLSQQTSYTGPQDVGAQPQRPASGWQQGHLSVFPQPPSIPSSHGPDSQPHWSQPPPTYLHRAPDPRGSFSVWKPVLPMPTTRSPVYDQRNLHDRRPAQVAEPTQGTESLRYFSWEDLQAGWEDRFGRVLKKCVSKPVRGLLVLVDCATSEAFGAMEELAMQLQRDPAFTVKTFRPSLIQQSKYNSSTTIARDIIYTHELAVAFANARQNHVALLLGYWRSFHELDKRKTVLMCNDFLQRLRIPDMMLVVTPYTELQESHWSRLGSELCFWHRGPRSDNGPSLFGDQFIFFLRKQLAEKEKELVPLLDIINPY